MTKRRIVRVLDQLMAGAIRAGATDAAVVDAKDVVVEDQLAELCLPPKCPNYGTSAGCPPYVGGPGEMRKRLASATQAIVIKIDVPSPGLLADEDVRSDLFGLLAEIAADVEQAALEMGYADARAYAGGGCKQIFCREHAVCRVTGEGGECRHPDKARPSMSGFGVNVGRLIQSAGWQSGPSSSTPSEADLFSICAMVLIS